MGSIIIFLFILILAYFYIIIIGGQTGEMFFYIICLSPFVSTILTLLIKNKIKITFKIPEAESEYHGIISVLIHVQNKSILPVPFLDILFIEGKSLKLPHPCCTKISLGPHKVYDYTINYNAVCRGVCDIGVSGVYLRDYLGIFKFLIPFDKEDSIKKITVVPRVIDIKTNNVLLLSQGRDRDAEEAASCESACISTSGEPGFELKEYENGDSPHRIHYKLSAKLGKLMVRKNESEGYVSKCIVIDPCICLGALNNKKQKKNILLNFFNNNTNKDNIDENEALKLELEEKIFEAVLSIINSYIKNNINAEVYLKEENEWLYYKVNDETGIKSLKGIFALYNFSKDIKTERIPVNSIITKDGAFFNESGKEIIIFSTMYDEALKEEINEGIKNNISSLTIYISSFKDSVIKKDNVLCINVYDDLNNAFSKEC